MEQFLKDVGERVRKARQDKNMSQTELAEKINTSTPYISSIENGKHIMKITVLYKLVEALDVSSDWLLRCKSQEAKAYNSEDFERLMNDCSPTEIQAMLNLMEAAKRSIRNVQDAGSSDK